MKKLIFAVTVLAMMASVSMGTVADMIAGNPKNGANVVGTVTVTDDGVNLTIVYEITNLDYIITETHVHVACDPEDLPQTKKGNAIPGQFDYSSSHEIADGVTQVTHTIPLPDCDTVYVAAHAVVGTLCPCDGETCEELDLPSDVMVSVLWAGDFDPDRLDSYFLATISGGTSLDGDYDAYCVDVDRSIRPPTYVHRGTLMQAYVYCNCEDLPTEGIGELLIENCDNWDLVLWILNNINVGDASTCDGDYTMGDIQRSIWELLDDDIDDAGLLDWEQCRVDEIIAAAEAEGEGYEPICTENIGIIILPYVYMIEDQVVVAPDTSGPGYPGDPIYPGDPDWPVGVEPVLTYVQPIVIEVPVPCCFCDDTAWAGVPGRDVPPPDDGDGYTIEFPGKDWSMYFTHIVDD